MDEDEVARGRRAGGREEEKGEKGEVYQGFRRKRDGRSRQLRFFGLGKKCHREVKLGGTLLGRLYKGLS